VDRRADGMRGQYSFKSGHFFWIGGWGGEVVVAELASSRVMRGFKVCLEFKDHFFGWPRR